MHFFSIQNCAFTIIGYPVSYIEFAGTLFGLISVYLASRANILTWPTGIFNELFLFLLFYQVQLYADMFLQIYFFITTLYGWYFWKQKANPKEISKLKPRNRWIVFIILIVGTATIGNIMKNIHIFLPEYFNVAAAYPFVDSFVMISSIVATVLLAKKVVENWHLWIFVDIVCVVLYFLKGIYFLSLEYFIFLLLATYGLVNWKKQTCI